MFWLSFYSVKRTLSSKWYPGQENAIKHLSFWRKGLHTCWYKMYQEAMRFWKLFEIFTLPLRGCSHITSAKFGGFQTPPPPLVSNGQHLPDPPSSPIVSICQTPLSHYAPLNSSKNTSWHDISMDWDVFWTYVLSWLYIVRPSLHKLFLFHIYLVV